MQHLIARWMRPAFLFLVLATGFGIEPAGANVTTDVTVAQAFYFTGVCSDCVGLGSAELVLSGFYTPGTTITKQSFVSFQYFGSNLLAAFTIDAAHLSYINGAFNVPFPGPENISLGSTLGNMQFLSSTSGFWCVGGACSSDTGVASVWSPTPNGSVPGVVPEPMPAALLGGGLIAGFLVRRKRRDAGGLA